MSSATRLLTGIARFFGSRRAADSNGTASSSCTQRAGDATATVEVDPRRVKGLRLSYSPITDGDPDPGEIIWTWVPYEERDGRGKDRPVLVVAAESGGSVLAVHLTSKDHADRPNDYVYLGSGRWDAQGRPSWANIERVFRVHPAGMRREAAALDRTRFVSVAEALHSRYGWRV